MFLFSAMCLFDLIACTSVAKQLNDYYFHFPCHLNLNNIHGDWYEPMFLLFQAALTQFWGVALTLVSPALDHLIGILLIVVSVFCTMYIGPDKETEWYELRFDLSGVLCLVCG